MSTLTSIVDKTTALVASIGELLATDTVEALPGVAAELGIEDVFNEGVSLLANLLGELNTQLGRLDDAIAHLDALGGLLALLEPLVGALGRMVGDTGNELASYGLGAIVEVTGPISAGFGYAEQALQIASNIVIDASSFAELRSEIAELGDRVLALRTDAQPEAIP
ncbi:MAG TPA: hypothetical protein VM869_01235 [Enhygromyxa sp.]|nr:hypothetical protein [Enhygromyxa sp.]